MLNDFASQSDPLTRNLKTQRLRPSTERAAQLPGAISRDGGATQNIAATQHNFA